MYEKNIIRIGFLTNNYNKARIYKYLKTKNM